MIIYYISSGLVLSSYTLFTASNLGGGCLLNMCARDLLTTTLSVLSLVFSDSNGMCHSPPSGILYPLSTAPYIVLF